MQEGRYVQVRGPWQAALTSGAGEPLRYYTTLIMQSLRYGMPARRFGRFGAWLIRRGIPRGPLARLFTVMPRRPRPDLDALLQSVQDDWGRLVHACSSLPEMPPSSLSVLALQRAAALSVFVFGGQERPLMVCKVRTNGGEVVEHEALVLRDVGRLNIAPRYLGVAADAHVQEGLPGRALQVQAVTPQTAGAIGWTQNEAALAAALVLLAGATAVREPVDDLQGPIERALADGNLKTQTRRRLSAALNDLQRAGVSVIRHGDTSPQNCLFDASGLRGLVDWERAARRGVPGFDTLNLAVALVEQGVGLVQWSEGRALSACRTAWSDSELFTGARRAARDALCAAGMREPLAAAAEVAFFGRRLGRRLELPSGYATGVSVAEKMLEHVCEH